MYNKQHEFEFDEGKEAENIKRHGVSFELAKEVFADPDKLYSRDEKHSYREERWYAVGQVSDGRILTVWFTWREERIRMIGAAELRRWRKEYEKRKTAGSE